MTQEEISNKTIKWLVDRIEKTTLEQNSATELNKKIGKGAKLTAYKEVLEYLRKQK